MIEAIANFFGISIRFIYEMVNNNYLISILIFTFLTKLILFPLTFLQIKSTEKLQDIAPKDKAIREKYKNDEKKQAEELSKLYSENKINPLGGCLPILIQLPIILGMFYIVKQPLTYIIQTPQSEIKTYTATYLGKEESEVTDAEIKTYEIQIAEKNNIIDMNVGLGLNLGQTPSNVFSKEKDKKASPISLIIPILAVVLSFAQTKLMQKNNNTNADESAQQMQKSTNLMMPLLSGIISYTMPLALGVYWLFGSLLQILQQMLITYVTNKHKKVLELDKGGVVNEKN